MERLSDYDYALPPERIAQRPLEDRSSSKLLCLDRQSGAVQHRVFRDFPHLLDPGDVIVLNDTRVTALRLFGTKTTGGQVEMLLLRKRDSTEYEALVKPGRRLPPGTLVRLEGGIEATVGPVLDAPVRLVQFVPMPNLEKRLEALGQTPLPPYITERLEDRERYQTVYSRTEGSAAAPTAGLHFTPELLAQIESKGVSIATVTLDVSLDTFRPVESEDLGKHVMHGETARISTEAAALVNGAPGRVIAVGTTVVRTLESFATGHRKVEPGETRTCLFIRPGFRFQVVDAMLTNFHLPRTTMLVMLAAFAGRESVFRAYDEALRSDYRFLSFGDSMFIS